MKYFLFGSLAYGRSSHDGIVHGIAINVNDNHDLTIFL
jgi:hypothetical protein